MRGKPAPDPGREWAVRVRGVRARSRRWRVTRYRAWFPVDAMSLEQALAVAVDAMRPRAAPTRDGRPPELTVHEDPPPPPAGNMRWSWIGADRNEGRREAWVTYEHSVRPRASVAIFRQDAEPQVMVVQLTPGELASMVRTLNAFPIDLMDAWAMEDLRRRQAARRDDVDGRALFDGDTHGGGK